MTLDTLATLIIALCPGSLDKQFVRYHDILMSCPEYYVNCIIGKNGEFNDKDVKRCVETKPVPVK
jgi:hypothetical protein